MHLRRVKGSEHQSHIKKFLDHGKEPIKRLKALRSCLGEYMKCTTTNYAVTKQRLMHSEKRGCWVGPIYMYTCTCTCSLLYGQLFSTYYVYEHVLCVNCVITISLSPPSLPPCLPPSLPPSLPLFLLLSLLLSLSNLQKRLWCQMLRR